MTSANITIVYGCIPTLGDFFCHIVPELATLPQSTHKARPVDSKPGRFEKMFKPVRALGLSSIPSDGTTCACDKTEARGGPRFFEENPRELFTRTWQQQVARDYHSQLSKGWWEAEDSRHNLGGSP